MTFSNVAEKGTYDSEGRAVLTLSELERWLALQVAGGRIQGRSATFSGGGKLHMARSYRHLDIQERTIIETQLSLGARPGAIAFSLSRARSTILREIRRNGWRSPRELSSRRRGRAAKSYCCLIAERRARRLSAKARVARKLMVGNLLWVAVTEHLRHGLSPAQICRTLGSMAEPLRLSHETIYTALYAMPRGQLRSCLLAQMRCRHRKRKPRRSQQGRIKPSIPDMVLIDQRPEEVEMRLVPGHWEGDLIIGKGNLSQIGTLIERKTLFVALVKLNSSKAEETMRARSSTPSTARCVFR